MNTLIIHLSDMHIDNSGSADWGKERANLIARSAARSGPCAVVLVILSGDIAFSGLAEQYKIAEEFIESLSTEIFACTNAEVKVFVMPGNHDCDFTVSGKLRAFVRGQRSLEILQEAEMVEKLSEPLQNFRAFEAKVDNMNVTERSAVHKDAELRRDGVLIQVRGFNSPLYSDLNEKKGELYLPAELFESGWAANCLRVSVMHHSPAWFADPQARAIRTALRSNSHLILYGHEHVPEIGQVTMFPNGRPTETVEIDGGVIHEQDGSASSFITIEIDKSTRQLSVRSHKWDNTSAVFEAVDLAEHAREAGWLAAPRKAQAFQINADFYEKIQDPGMSIVAKSGRRIRLRDLYVPCDLVEEQGSNVEETFSADRLLIVDEFRGGAVVQGDEKYGKTTLLYRLYDQLHSAGLVPLYLGLRDHKIKSEKDILKVVRQLIPIQYPGENENTFAALSRDKRVLLVDDIDALTKPALREHLIRLLRSQCESFVVTSTLKTRMTEILGDGDEITEYRNLRLAKFSYQKRGLLIGLWLRNVEDVQDAEELIRRLDVLEKSASTALAHNLVPRVPQMLLIFLHSVSASSPTKLESSALANYYIYLVTRQLLDAGVPPEELEEYISFSRIVSYFMYSNERTHITLEELEVCNEKFAEEFYPGSVKTRLNVLRNSRLLVDFGSDAYQWRHTYLQYLFLGGFLAVHGDNPDVRDAIKKMCTHLYVRSNANALLFLVHFNTDRRVFDYLRQVIEGVFREAKPLRLGEDTREFAEVIRNAKDLVLPTNIMDEREKMRKARDEMEAKGGDGLSERERSDGRTRLEDLIVLFKAAEILGQVLKEQYASIQRSKREPVVVALHDAFLRAAGGIIKEMALNKKLLHRMLTKELVKKAELAPEKRVEAAQSIVSGVVQMFMFAFFQKLGESLSSDRTLDLIRHIKWPDSLEVKVFLLACELNLQRSIPLAKIDALLEQAKDDSAFVALIRNLVQVRVSLFHTRAPELQALAQRFKLGISGLNALDFRETKAR